MVASTHSPPVKNAVRPQDRRGTQYPSPADLEDQAFAVGGGAYQLAFVNSILHEVIEIKLFVDLVVFCHMLDIG